MSRPAEPPAADGPIDVDAPASLAASSALLTVTQVVGNAGFFVSVLLIAHELTRAGRGVVAFATTAALIVARVCDIGMGSATTILAAQRPQDRGRLLTNAAIFATVVGVVCGIGAALVIGAGGVGPHLQFLQLSALAAGVLGNTLLDVGYSFLVGVGRPWLWSIVAASSPWLYAVALLVFAVTGHLTVTAAVVAWAAAHLYWGLGTVVNSRRAQPLGRPDWALFRETLHLGVRAWGASLARFLNFRVDQIVLGLMASEAVLGVYATAVNASEVSLYIPLAVASAAIASIARVSPRERGQQALATFRPLLIVTLGVVVAAGLIGIPALPVVFGARYDSAVTPYLVLLPGALGFVAMGVFSSALLNSRRPVLSSVPASAALVVGLVFDLILIPPYGATGAALAATLAFFGGGLAAVLAYRRVTSFRARDLVPARADLRVIRDFVSHPVRALIGDRRAERRSRLKLRSDAYYRLNHTYRQARITFTRVPSAPVAGVRILGYHRVTRERDPLAIDPDLFRRQLEWMLEQGARPVRVDDTLHLLDAAGSHFAVTFDDGYLDNLELAVPILDDLAIPATIYVATSVLDGTSQFDWYKQPPPALSWDDARAIAAGGLVDIQPHTRTHPALPRLSDQAAWAEIAGSKEDVERELGRPCTSFAYPAGIYGPREVELVRRAGFLAAVTTNAGVNANGANPLELRRTLLLTGDTFRDFQARVRGALDTTSGLERLVRSRRATPEG